MIKGPHFDDDFTVPKLFVYYISLNHAMLS